MNEKKLRQDYEKLLQNEILSQVKLDEDTQSVEANTKRLSQIIQDHSTTINLLAWAMKLADNMNPHEKAIISNEIKAVGIKWKLEVEVC